MPKLFPTTVIKFIEALGVSLFVIAVGYLLNRDDPCFLTNKINISLFVLTILTLFFGWAGLFSFLSMYALGLALFYERFAIYPMLELTALGLILYFFHYVWETKNKELEVKERYLRQKLEENTTAFYTLKASYDQLEKSYITKPFSLKDSLQKILQIAKKEPHSAYEEFLKLLKGIYHVQKASITLLKEEKLQKQYNLQTDTPFRIEDPLVQKAHKSKQPVYIDLSTELPKTSYIAAIPVEIDKTEALLLIESIRFNTLSKDTLLQISVIFTYLVQSLYKESFLQKEQCHYNFLGETFALELCRLQYIQKTYQIRSSALSLRSKNQEYMKRLYFTILKQKRTIDTIQTLTINHNEYVILLLFPFMSAANIQGFMQRLKKSLEQDIDLLNHLNSNEFIYKIGDINPKRVENLLR